MEVRTLTGKALDAGAARLIEMMELLPDAVVLCSGDGRIVYVNPQAERAFGYRGDELVGQPVEILVPERYRGAHPAHRARFNARPKPRPMGGVRELSARRKDGTEIAVDIMLAGLELGGETLQLCVLRDIQRRKDAETLILRLGRMLDSSSNEIYAFEADGLRIVQANRSALDDLGYTLAELQRLTPLDLQPEFDRESFERQLQPLRRAETEQIRYETLHRRKDGSPYAVEVAVQFMGSESPPVFIAIAQNVEARRETEQRLQKLASAVEQTADAVIISDISGIIEYVNPAFVRITGYGPDEAIGRTPSFLKSGRLDEKFYRRLWSTILRGEPFHEVFVNRRKDGSLYYEEKTITPIKDARGRITHFVSTGKDITDNLDLRMRLRHLAGHDVLTQLPNRSLLSERLSDRVERARRRRRLLALLYLDIDRFRNANEVLGTAAGDRLLRSAAQRLRDCVPDSGLVGRLGDDEFGAILTDLGSVNDAGLTARKILIALSMPYRINGDEIHLTASMGIGLFPHDADGAEALLKHAEIAMSRAKAQGGNRFCFYEPGIDARTAERMALEMDLQRALDNREFLLHYQPQVDCRTGEIRGVEAFLRWMHPRRGLLPPAEFFTLLDDTGPIAPVSVWALRTACEQSHAWRAAGLLPPPIAVNVSSRRFHELDYAEFVRLVLEETALDPDLLHVEVSDRILARGEQSVRDTIEALAALGVTVVVDDFAVGYSSFKHLKDLSVSAIKLDMALQQQVPEDAEDRVMMSAIIDIAHQQDLVVIAEGVETEAQARFLKAQGCDVIQGNVISPPVSAIEFTRLLQRRCGDTPSVRGKDTRPH